MTNYSERDHGCIASAASTVRGTTEAINTSCKVCFTAPRELQHDHRNIVDPGEDASEKAPCADHDVQRSEKNPQYNHAAKQLQTSTAIWQAALHTTIVL